VVVRLTEDWFASRLGKDVTEESPVDQIILNTHVQGTAHTVGRSHVKLQSDPQRASFRIVFSGVTNSRTTGRHGPAILSSRSQTQYTATKRIVFVPGEGFRTQPANIDANPQTTTDDIRSTRGGWIGRLVVRRAWRKVAENKPLTTEIARQNAMSRIAAAFDRRVEGMLASWNRAADLRETLALMRGQDGSPGYTCRSTSDYVEFALASQAPSGEHARVRSPPALAELPGSMQVWVHRSLVPPQLLQRFAQMQSAQASLASTLEGLSRIVPVSHPRLPSATDAPGRTNFVPYQFVEDWTVISLPAASVESTPVSVAAVPSAGARR
jgi:hypothetical protein